MALSYSRPASAALRKVPLFSLACLIPARAAGLRLSLWYKQFATTEEKDTSETRFSETLQTRFQEVIPEEGLLPLWDCPHHISKWRMCQKQTYTYQEELLQPKTQPCLQHILSAVTSLEENTSFSFPFPFPFPFHFSFSFSSLSVNPSSTFLLFLPCKSACTGSSLYSRTQPIKCETL